MGNQDTYFYYELTPEGKQKNPSIGIGSSGPIMSGTPQTYESAQKKKKKSKSSAQKSFAPTYQESIIPVNNVQTSQTEKPTASVSKFTPPTPAQIKETGYLKAFYGGGTSLQNSDYLVRKARAEAYTAPTPHYKTNQRGTATYGYIPESKETQYIKQTDIAVLGFGVKYGVDVEKEKQRREELLEKKSEVMSISSEDLKKEQDNFTKWQKNKALQSNSELQKEINSITNTIYPESKKVINFSPEKAQRYFYNKDIPTGVIKVGVGAAAFSAGAINAAISNKREIVKQLAIGAGLTIGTAGLGSVATAAGVSAKAVNIAGKTIKYGSLGYYGFASGKNIFLTPGGYAFKSYKAGELLTLDIAPFLIGSKAGGYAVRRYTLAQELKMQTEALPELKRKRFISELGSAKKLLNVQPKVKDVSLKGMERIPASSEKIITDYLESHKKLIVGGSVAQRTQLYVPESKPPSDIDIFVKGYFQELKSRFHGWNLGRKLKNAGISRVSSSPTISGQITIGGKKAIEFHPFESYLKANIEQVLPWYRTSRYGLTKTPRGVKVQRLSLQLQRKLIGGYLEPERASKDLPAAAVIKQSLLNTRRLQENKNVLKDYIELNNAIIKFNKRGGLFGKSPLSPPPEYKQYRGYKSYGSYKSYVYYRNYKPYNPYKAFSPYNPFMSYSPKMNTNISKSRYLPKNFISNPRLLYKQQSLYTPWKNIGGTSILFPPKSKSLFKGYYWGHSKRGYGEKSKYEQGYQVFLKRRNKYQNLPGIYGRGDALALLEKALFSSLTARGGIKKTAVSIMVKPRSNYVLSSKIFRAYQIKNRKPIMLKEEWIQRRSKRLITPMEKAEILLARRKKKTLF